MLKWMVVILVTKNKKFKLLFRTKNNQEIDLDYYLHDSIIAEKWFKKVKHLQSLPIDEIESQRVNLDNLMGIYKEFCKFTNTKPIKFVKQDKDFYNSLHEIFEKAHQKSSKQKNNSIIYKFHHAIHYHQSKKQKNSKSKNIHVGWGIKEGPLNQNFLCNSFYENSIKKNYIYQPWSELGKRPWQYWQDKEVIDTTRFNNLCLPHLTLRPKFFISLVSYKPDKFSKNFDSFFKKFKNKWIKKYNLTAWTEKDEFSAPLLGIPVHNEDPNDLRFVKLILQS